MRNLVVVVILVLTSVATAFSQNVTNGINDFDYVKAIHEKTFNYDTRSVRVEGQENPVLLETRRNNGTEFGFHVGADYFNGVLSPTIGAEVGYHGSLFGVWGTASVGRSEYNELSSLKGEPYTCVNFAIDGGVKAFNLPSRYLNQREVWLIGQFGYKLRQNENEYFEEGVDGSMRRWVKGSSMTFGAGIKIDFKNYMKGNNWYIKAIGYTGHEYYETESKIRYGVNLSLGFNFVVPSRHSYNDKAINKIFGSRENYKSAIKGTRRKAKSISY